MSPTLRDQFAMAALPGLVSVHGVGLSVEDVAEDAYAIADAMLAARGPDAEEPCRHCNDVGRAPRLNGADRCGCPAAQKEAGL